MKRILILVLLVGLLTSAAAPASAQTGTSVASEEKQDVGEIWDNYYAFVAGIVLLFAIIGMWGKSLAVGAWLAYLAFARIATETQSELLVSILYVSLVLVFVGFAFKLWRLEFGGE